MEMETTLAPVVASAGVRTSCKPAAQSSTCDGKGKGGSSGTRKQSCGGSIASGSDTKRPRTIRQVEPVFDVTAGDDWMSGEEEVDMKLELDVCAPSGYVSSALSYLRGRRLDERVRAHPFPG